MLALPLALLLTLNADPACRVGGRVTSSSLPLPGVALVVSDGTTDVGVSSTDLDGAYQIALPGPGRYTLKAGLAGFAEAVHEIEVAAESCVKPLDVTLTLKSRTAAATPPAAPAEAPRRPDPAAAGGVPGRFRDLSLVPGSPPGEAREEGDAAASLSLPAGFSTEAPADAVTSTGGPIEIADNNFFRDRMEMLDAAGGDLEMMARRMGMGMGMGGGMEGLGFPGGGMGGGFGGRIFQMGGGGGDRLQGNVSHSIGGSALDAAPYPLHGEAEKADYTQQRASAMLSGPLRLPGIYDGRGKTRFTVNYSGSWDSRPYNAYSTVPTDAERAGDLSGRSRNIYDPQTGLRFPGNTIPDSRIDPAARTLLEFIPRPNLPGDTQNFHYVTSNRNRADNFSLQINHRFGEAAGRGRPGAGGRPQTERPSGERPPAERPPAERPPAERAPGDRRGFERRGMGQRAPNLNVSVSYNHLSSRIAARFPTLGGENSNRTWNANAGFSFSKGRASHQSRVNFTHNRSEGLNLYAFNRDVAGEAGIIGVATEPFDWGIPNLAFTTFADLNDRNPTSSVNRRLQVSHSVTYPWKRHNLRVGAELRTQALDSQTDTNARGSFVFTGLYTSAPGGGPARDGGLDFADFLLGLPQQASVQFGPGRIRFRSRSWSVFLQDDWRLNGTVTLNAGLRYEYISPFEETNDHLVNLDVPPDFTDAAPVLAGQAGPFTGPFPEGLVRSDRNNLAPRVGLAWRPSSRTTVRTGYGINYNLGAYSFIAQRLSGQPPFATSNTSQGTPPEPLSLTSPFLVVAPGTVTNSYGIDKDYRLGAVHVWNVDVTRDLGRGWSVSGGYVGTAGRSLDMQRAPNRDRDGLRIPDVQAFLWQSSEGRSNNHALNLRVRKRMARGFSAGVNYTLTRSRDNASSLGGGGMVVAQDDRDLEAEWGRSSFERRHRLSLNAFWELPFGNGRRFLQKGFWAAVAGGWTWSADAILESGGPFTARVRGDFLDVARGVNGTLRADYTGDPIEVRNPTIERWFNTAAFLLPPAGRFGNADRNTITGPGTRLVNMSLTRNVSLGRPRNLQVRLEANNVFNTPQLGAIDTVVNSPTFGQVVSVRAMRSVRIETRLRF
jgi:trimeric autotransporter adhesin